MTQATATDSNHYALLIGIDCYMPNRLPDGSCYRNLGGCVRDISHVEALLKEQYQLPESNILKLTASVNPAAPSQPIEPPEQLPTRQNIIDRFRKLGEIAPAGSQVYIQYSGHGGRAKTIFSDIKDANDIDEGLVPTDIGTPEGQYIRDLELAQLLKELVDKQLIVTLVLDCCHSGEATRGLAEVRGNSAIGDKAIPAGFVPVAAPEILAANWQTLAEQNVRGLSVAGLPESNGYVLLAACRPNEFAYEYAFNRETGERNGALTYWLLDTLRQQNSTTYKDLFDRIHAKIHSQFPQQTPMLMGKGDRAIFGSSEFRGTPNAPIVYAVPVLKVESEAGELRAVLGVGQQNGVGKGSEFAIYPRGTTDFTNPDQRRAIARIVERGADQSICQLTPIAGRTVEQGDQAVQVSASVNLVRQVMLLEQPMMQPVEQSPPLPPNKLLPEIYQQQAAALEAVKTAIAGNGWVELTESAADSGGVDFLVALNNKAEYEICDSAGMPLINIVPALRIDDPNAPAKLVKRLIHLAKYRTVSEIDNTDIDSPLAGKLSIEWLGTSDSYELGDPLPRKFTPFPDPSQPTVKAGAYVFLSIQNNSPQALNVAVLNFEADWSIAQITPADPGAKFITLEPSIREVIPLRSSVEGRGDAVENTVKVFATIGEANFRWLELPSLDQALVSKGLRSAGNPLETLLASIDAEWPPTRQLTVAASPSREWTTRQMTLRITP